jgi:hypothetical protein
MPNLKMPKLKVPSGGRGKPAGAASNLKPPKVVADLYADLRERRLLPLVALLAVAIVAAPFLLSDDSGSSSPTPIPLPPEQAQVASFSVVPAAEQLRDYRKRLQHRKRESPFNSYAAARVSNETREEVEGALEGDEEGSVEGGGAEAPVAPAESSPPAQAPVAEPPVVKATVDLGVMAVVKVGYVDAVPHAEKIGSQTKLPKPEQPVVVYTGPSKDEQGALFLMSTDVSAYYGSGKCVLGGQLCQVLELRPGKSATFAVGYGETRYKVTLLGFEPIVREATIQPRR